MSITETETDRASIPDSDALERQRATLLRNELIAGNEAIAKHVLSAASTVRFTKGEAVITQGNSDDCVYFILSGQAEILKNKMRVDTCAAPSVVGELAAKLPGTARTATVIVSSSALEALVLSGTEFRKLMQVFPEFSSQLAASMDTQYRKKIEQLGEPGKPAGMPWPMIAAVVAGSLGLAAMVVAYLAALSPLLISLSGLAIGAFIFVSVLLLNPELRYRNMASAAGYALVMIVLYGSISFFLTIDGYDGAIPFVFDFSVQAEQKLGVLVVAVIALLILIKLSGNFDLEIGRASKK